jgi:hypothetical protein
VPGFSTPATLRVRSTDEEIPACVFSSFAQIRFIGKNHCNALVRFSHLSEQSDCINFDNFGAIHAFISDDEADLIRGADTRDIRYRSLHHNRSRDSQRHFGCIYQVRGFDANSQFSEGCLRSRTPSSEGEGCIAVGGPPRKLLIAFNQRVEPASVERRQPPGAPRESATKYQRPAYFTF